MSDGVVEDGSMRAVLFRRSGSVEGLEPAVVPRPSPGVGELLIRVHAATVTRGDVVLRKLPRLLARLFGLPRKTMLGHEYAGVVEEAGDEVERFGTGDRVFGTTSALTAGSPAGYLCVPETGIVATIPDGVTFEEAAPIPIGGLTALQILRAAGPLAGKTVLVYGASGSVGSYEVQLAAHQGGTVTGVSSGANADMVRALGATDVIDYRTEDVTATGRRWDVVFDAVASSPRRRRRGS